MNKVAGAICLLLTASLWPHPAARSFLDEQLAHSRVRAASAEKDALWRNLFAEKKLAFPPRRLLLIAFKWDAALEVWAADGDLQPYTLLKTLRICASSGELGPKRQFGDSQVPEGFYVIDQFNPESSYYLSLHVSYPNSSDRVLASAPNPGGDIFVHGDCVTIGCIPITNEGIKEVYWLAVLARQSGEKQIPIWIFPTRLNNDNFKALVERHRGNPGLIAFWGQLKQGYDFFAKDHRIPSIFISTEGQYQFAVR